MSVSRTEAKTLQLASELQSDPTLPSEFNSLSYVKLEIKLYFFVWLVLVLLHPESFWLLDLDEP